jgi:hypothetical protein
MVATAQPNVSDNMELSAQFMAHAEAVFQGNNLELDASSKPFLQQDFDNAASNMTSENRLGPADIGQAHYAVGLYAQTIVVRTRCVPTPVPATVITFDVIQKVHDFFCPGFWPFC